MIEDTYSLSQSDVDLLSHAQAPTHIHVQRLGSGDKRDAVDWYGEHIAPATLLALGVNSV